MDLQAYLSDAGITPSEFAIAIGVTPTSVKRYIDRTRTPRGTIMARIIRATDGRVGPDDLWVPPSDSEVA